MSEDRLPLASATPDTSGSRTVVQQTPPQWLVDAPAGSATTLAELPGVQGAERYELLEVIARGGMGVVYRARDRVLNREVGVKTLLGLPPQGSAIVARFRSEAHITGQLQHPNIPPVHDLGTLPDGRPFLAMKLIKGRTLDAMLKDRTDSRHKSGRDLAIFEQIAQGVAYAHAHSVVHRDLKPLNIMVGAFGEVQVMDWGLAKGLRISDCRLRNEGTQTDVPSDNPQSEIRIPQSEETRPGSIFGTPAYMPREQAIGAVDQIDRRSDVFSLGGILCVLLTGKPPYVGDDSESTRQLAALADLADAFGRLDASGAEPDLIALCKRCLSPPREERPPDAGAVANAVAELRTEAERRARQAELDRARAELQAAEQRKRRLVQLALLASLMLLAASVGAFTWWRDRQATERQLAEERLDGDRKAADARADTERAFKVQQAREGIAASLTLSANLRKQYKFKLAKSALAQAAELAKAVPERLDEVRQAQADLDFVQQLDDIRYRKWTVIADDGTEGKGDFNPKIAPPEYHKAFTDRDMDLTALSPAEAAKRIAASAVKADLVAAVDDWALYEPDDALRARLLEIARTADPGHWTDRLRDPSLWKGAGVFARLPAKAALAQLASEADPTTTSSASLSMLTTLMRDRGLNPSAILAAARTKHPTDFELTLALGQWHSAGKEGEQIGPYEAARALRPENVVVWNNLGIALIAKGDVAAAIAAYREASRLNPKSATPHTNLGVALRAKGDVAGAIAEYKEAIRLDPKLAQAHNSLGIVLHDKSELAGAIGAFQEAIRLDPKFVQAHYNLGNALRSKGDLAGAITAFREAIRLDPKDAQAHTNLGAIYLGQKKYPEAIASARAAIKADPKLSNAHAMLGDLLLRTGDIPGARQALTEAARLDKRWAGMLAKLPPVAVAPPPREKR